MLLIKLIVYGRKWGCNLKNYYFLIDLLYYLINYKILKNKENRKMLDRESKPSAKLNGCGVMIDLFAILKSIRNRKKYSNSAIVKTGFTLIEMSIVLVIIGLLIGGIITGQSLIKTAELQSVISDMQTYKQAYNIFKTKYNCIPGDCARATELFGAANSDFNACAALTTPSTGKLTCNGNGNGQIGGSIVTTQYETFRFWQHLVNANLIKGNYTGVAGSLGGFDAVPGINTPVASIVGTGFDIIYWDTATGNSANYAMNYGNVFSFGKKLQGLALGFGEGVFTPKEAFAIEKKIDDGFPATGFLIAKTSPYTWNSTDTKSCSTSVDQYDFTGKYKTHSTVSCAFSIITGE